MKKIIFVIIMTLIFSCKKTKTKIFINLSNVNSIEINKGFPHKKVIISDETSINMIEDLKKLKVIGPCKFKKGYSIIIKENSKIIDTLRTNGKIFVSRKGYFESENNLLKKYNITN